MLWDRGFWAPDDGGKPERGLHKGDLKFTLAGEKLQGSWVLVRMRPDHERDRSNRNNWLLIKHRDGFEREGRDPVTEQDRSVASGRNMPSLVRAVLRLRSPAKKSRKNQRITDKQNAVRAGNSLSDCGHSRVPAWYRSQLAVLRRWRHGPKCKLDRLKVACSGRLGYRIAAAADLRLSIRPLFRSESQRAFWPPVVSGAGAGTPAAGAGTAITACEPAAGFAVLALFRACAAFRCLRSTGSVSVA